MDRRNPGMSVTLICIVCPVGCELTVSHDDERIIEVRGARCGRGGEYAEREVFHPERIVTTTVRIRRASVPLVPVRTSRAIARNRTFEVLEQASQLWCTAPVRAGQVLSTDIAGTGADLVATRALEEVSPPHGG